MVTEIIRKSKKGKVIGQGDFPIPLARKLLGEDTIIGGSAKNLAE